MTVIQPGDPAARDRIPPRLSFAQLLPLALVVLAPGACLDALLDQAGKPTPPVNPGLRPMIVVPGDSCNCFLPDIRVEGVGLWRGQPTVRVLNAREVGAPEKIDALGNNDPFGAEVTVHTHRFENPTNHPFSPLIRINLPKDPALGGKTLRLQVTMNMTYAVLKGRDQFIPQSANVSTTFPVQIAGPETLHGVPVYLFGIIAGGAASALGGIWFVLLALKGPKGTAAGEVFLSETAGLAP
jgi:hypothetical protein